ncbi:MAG: hypothetical protein R3E10_07680 [Gemmatimonadota bacterium]
MHEPVSEPSPGFLAWLTSPLGALTAFGALVVARLLAGNFGYFYEGDEISIAGGVAALLNGDGGPLYRYGPQLGYYRLLQGIARLAGGIDGIHGVMVVVSAVAGAAIPASGLRAFRRQLEPSTRVLIAAVLFANPALWVASQYGNAATVSTALVVAAVTVLSNASAGSRLLLGLVLYSGGVLVRADAALVAPMIAVLVWQATGSLKRAALVLAAAAAGGVALYALLFALDPSLRGMFAQVTSHFEDDNQTLFFEHLVWAVSPLALAFAVLGLREGLSEHKRVVAPLLAGVLPLFLFYFPTTTTTRYFLQAVFPLGILVGLGMQGAVALAPRPRRNLAWSLVLALGFLHLVLGLGRFEARPFSARLRAPSYGTHDSAMYTGALLYQAYLQSGVFGRSLRGPGFGVGSELATELGARLEPVSRGEGPGRVVLFFHDWNGHAVVYHLPQAGAHLTEGDLQGDILKGLTYRLGRTDIRVLWFGPATRQLPHPLPVGPGDEVWLLGPQAGFPQSDVLAALAPGLHLEPRSGEGAYLEIYTVNEEAR